MTQERLQQILQERLSNYDAFKRDGYLYFEELMPLLELLSTLIAPSLPVERVEKKILEGKERLGVMKPSAQKAKAKKRSR